MLHTRSASPFQIGPKVRERYILSRRPPSLALHNNNIFEFRPRLRMHLDMFPQMSRRLPLLAGLRAFEVATVSAISLASFYLQRA